jgi:hypothetical protein
MSKYKTLSTLYVSNNSQGFASGIGLPNLSKDHLTPQILHGRKIYIIY